MVCDQSLCVGLCMHDYKSMRAFCATRC